MTTVKSLASHLLVAATAATVSSALTLGAVRGVPETPAPTLAASDVRDLMIEPLSDIPGREVRIVEINRAPGADPLPHQHPGHHTFGYVVEGTYEFGINGGPTQILGPGDAFYEPIGSTHSKSRNASDERPLKLVVFFLADSNNPSTITLE
jgi:quercetin dioxygenase-like cupin family protein